jgi:hypothetical protein
MSDGISDGIREARQAAEWERTHRKEHVEKQKASILKAMAIDLDELIWRAYCQGYDDGVKER